jgi:hypothetical protein
VEREAQERVLRVKVESVVVLASSREEIDSLVRKIALLEAELAEVRQDHELAEETARGLPMEESRAAGEDYPFADPGLRVVLCHYQSSTSKESPIGGDMDCCSPPHRDGWRASRP